MNQDVRKRIIWGWRGATSDTAIWNTQLIEEFNLREDIELHVIAPSCNMRHMVQRFRIGRVHYYYFKVDVPFLHVSWKHFWRLDQRTKYWWTRRVVQNWINEINPDIVNLVGAENPHYSASVIGLKGYPILISMQGIYSNPIRFQTEKEDQWRTKFERQVHSENCYFGLNAGFMKELILRDCPRDAFFFWNRPLNREMDLLRYRTNTKKFDFVFFSRINENKGIFDVMRAAAIVRRTHPNMTVRVIGYGGADIESRLQQLIKDLDLNDCIIRSQGYKNHFDLMDEVSKARYHILPTYIDTIPCTIFEGLRLGLPLISYYTGDIPKLNIGGERVLLVKQGDISGLASQMKRLMDCPNIAKELQCRALEFIDSYFSNKANVEQLLLIYHAIIDNYNKGIPIPEVLSYDEYLERKVRL